MQLLRGAKDLAEFIASNYSGHVVEIGGGHVLEVAMHLLSLGRNITVTDKEERIVGRIHIKKDDIFEPRLDIYQGASLLYSIRPPLEMQLAMGVLASRLCVDILIRPLNDEIAELPGFSRRLINAGEASFYLFRKNR